MDICKLISYLADFLSSLVVYDSFSVDFWGELSNIWSTCLLVVLVLFTPFQFLDFFRLLLVPLHRMWNNSGDSELPCLGPFLVLVLYGLYFGVVTLNMTLALGLRWIYFIMSKNHTSSSVWLSGFDIIKNGGWILPNTFSVFVVCLHDFILELLIWWTSLMD